MKKLWWAFWLVGALGLGSCRIEKADAVNFPNVESYSPGYAKTGTEVSVIGSNLSGASIYLGGQPVDLLSTSDRKLSFLVTDAMSTGNIEVRFSNELFESQAFAMDLVVNHVITGSDKGGWLSASLQNVGDTLVGPNQLLITDFDGTGIRKANETTQFDRTRFSSQVPTGGLNGIGQISGVMASPAGGNYFYSELAGEFVQNGTFGYSGDLISRSKKQNDLRFDWPSNFVDYPESPLVMPTSRADLSKIYLNMAVFKNQNQKGLFYLDLTNEGLSNSQKFNNRSVSGVGVSEWTWVSVPFSQFKDGFGFGSTLDLDDFGNINIVSLAFVHQDKSENQIVEAQGNANYYIDNIIITQGQPFYGNVR